MAMAPRLTYIHSNLFTNAEAMDSLEHDCWKRAMEGEFIFILLNNKFTTLNSMEARQWQFKPIGSK